MMVGGAVLGMFGVPLPPVEAGIALSVLVLGTCIALRFEAPVWIASFIVACFAIFHGYGTARSSHRQPISRLQHRIRACDRPVARYGHWSGILQ